MRRTVEEGTVTGTAEIMVTRSADNTVTRTVVGTRNSIKWLTERELMSECKKGGGWTRRYL